MSEEDTNPKGQHLGRHKDLAYEPCGLPTERVRRLQYENRVLPAPPVEIKRHREIPAHMAGHIPGDNAGDCALDAHLNNSSHDFNKADIFKYSRRRMVQEQLVSRNINDKHVLRAMESIPRHLFISEALHATAYEDRPLPIANGQTISQPYVVAFMCQLLLAEPLMKVLEIGTGSGYQAAVLHEMGLKVFSVERIQNLYENTRVLLQEKFRYKNMVLHLSDGTLGWTQHALYDRIIVAAGGPSVPQALKDQLAEGGVMLIPIGDERKKQRIVRVFKINGQCKEEDCGPVSFVDLVGADGWR